MTLEASKKWPQRSTPDIEAIRKRLAQHRLSALACQDIDTLLAEVDRLAGIVDLAEGIIRSHEQRITHLAQQRDEIKALGDAMSEAIGGYYEDSPRYSRDAAKAAWENR